MKRNALLIITALMLASLDALHAADKPAPQRPNILVIVTDDQGYGELSCHGNPVLQTPHLDRLHDESVRFTDFHVAHAPLGCSPVAGDEQPRLGPGIPTDGKEFSVWAKRALLPAHHGELAWGNACLDIHAVAEIVEDGLTEEHTGVWGYRRCLSRVQRGQRRQEQGGD